MSNRRDVRRVVRNEESLNHADKHKQPWSPEETQTLLDMWPGNLEDLTALAELLGRTVEACRQRYYFVTTHETVVTEKAAKSTQNLSKWSKGFTSLDDMGY